MIDHRTCNIYHRHELHMLRLCENSYKPELLGKKAHQLQEHPVIYQVPCGTLSLSQ